MKKFKYDKKTKSHIFELNDNISLRVKFIRKLYGTRKYSFIVYFLDSKYCDEGHAINIKSAKILALDFLENIIRYIKRISDASLLEAIEAKDQYSKNN